MYLAMRISYQNEPLFPGKPARFFNGPQLYHYYEQSDSASTAGVHWFDFQTNVGHTLNVCYPSSFYKMVLCIAGESRSAPKHSQGYGFNAGKALFYRTDEEPYQAILPGNTCFKVIHIHLSKGHVAMLQRDAPELFEQHLSAMSLSAGYVHAFSQLKTLSRESSGLLHLFEEKLIIDQLFDFASHTCTRSMRKSGERAREKAILQEAVWHISRAGRYLTIAELAKLTGTNTFRIKQLFREQMRTSVFQYQCDLRLERAAQFLLDTDLDIAEIALECGYESAAAFSNAFLRKHGMRPSAFKNSRSGK